MSRRPVLYVILCYDQARLVCDLFRYLYSPEDIYLFHTDLKAKPPLVNAIDEIVARYNNAHLLTGLLCSWGGYSLVVALFKAIECGLEIDDQWQHLVLLSEHHVPLQTPDTCAGQLVPGVSWLDVNRVNTMFPDAQTEIRRRFGAHYHELPGVGPFAMRPRRIDPAIWDRLYHGSQWVVLARTACERLRDERTGYAELLEWFASSALPDETALPTLLQGTPLGRDLPVALRNSTYLAWPHVGGLPGMVFCEANVIEAQNRGDLFIRKRPEHLDPSFLETLEKRALIPPEALSDIASTPNLDIDTSQVLAAEALTETLRAALPDVPMHDIAATGRGALPTFYIRLLPPLSADDTISVNIVSEDLHHFMIVVMVADGSTALQRLRDEGIFTSMIRARVPGLAYQIEICLSDDPHSGS